MPVSAVGDQTLSSFYATTTAVLLALLISWLVAEARRLREDLIASADGGTTASRSGRIPGGSILAVASVLTVGALVALRVQFRGKAESWEEVLVWSALGLGFVGVGLSLVMAVLVTDKVTRNETLFRGLNLAKKVVPVTAALALGFLASPLVDKKPVRFVGAKFAVYGTCLSAGCGLKQRHGPGSNFPAVDRREWLSDGDQVLVVCQTTGPPPKGYSNRIWDRLPNGRYVSDAFVDTPNRQGGFSAGLPRCQTRDTEGTVG